MKAELQERRRRCAHQSEATGRRRRASAAIPMQRCASCGRTILFGGRHHGNARFCNDTCLLNGLLLLQGQGERDGSLGFREAIVGLHDDLEALTAEVQDQRVALSEALERLDSLERSLVRLCSSGNAPPGSTD